MIFYSCSCVKGTLIEVNENLIANPQLLRTKARHTLLSYDQSPIALISSSSSSVSLITQPLSEGYVAIAIPKLSEAASTCSHLLTEYQYKELKRL